MHWRHQIFAKKSLEDLAHEMAGEHRLRRVLGPVSLTAIGEKQVTQTWLDATQRLTAGAVGGLLGFSLRHMGYVVWRDYDVVKLQKMLIDSASAREEQDKQTLAAEDRIGRIRAAGLRQVGIADPKPWDEN